MILMSVKLFRKYTLNGGQSVKEESQIPSWWPLKGKCWNLSIKACGQNLTRSEDQESPFREAEQIEELVFEMIWGSIGKRSYSGALSMPELVYKGGRFIDRMRWDLMQSQEVL